MLISVILLNTSMSLSADYNQLMKVNICQITGISLIGLRRK